MRHVLILAAVLAIIVVACSANAPVCNSPYIPNGPSCCLDKDADGVCDQIGDVVNDTLSAASCDLCPPRFVTQKEEVVVYRYVCQNGSIMTQPDACGTVITSDATLFSAHKDQDETIIKTFGARPACRGEYPAAELHLEMLRSPQKIILEVKDDPQGQFVAIGSRNGTKEVLDDEYFYIGLCTTIECDTVTDARVAPEGAFLVRASIVFADTQTTTRDLLIDPTPQGEYGKKRC